MIQIELAKPSDFKAFFRTDAPELLTALLGRDANGRILGMGGVAYDDWGRAWGFLNTRLRPTFTLHRQALRFMAAMRAVGEPAIYTTCDLDESPRAAAWLERLGFAPTDEFKPELTEDVWKWTLMKGHELHEGS